MQPLYELQALGLSVETTTIQELAQLLGRADEDRLCFGDVLAASEPINTLGVKIKLSTGICRMVHLINAEDEISIDENGAIYNPLRRQTKISGMVCLQMAILINIDRSNFEDD